MQWRTCGQKLSHLERLCMVEENGLANNQSGLCGMTLDRWTVLEAFIAWDASMWGEHERLLQYYCNIAKHNSSAYLRGTALSAYCSAC
jgi:hypothetical protein